MPDLSVKSGQWTLLTLKGFIKDYDSQHVTRYLWENFHSQHAVLWNSESQNATLPCAQSAIETTVPSMQRRPWFLASRWTLLRRDLLVSSGRVLKSQPPLGDVSGGHFWRVRPVQTKPRRDWLGPGPGFSQAAFEAAPTGSSWGLSPFEQRWRAGALSPAPLRAGTAITMATAASRPYAGGSRDILWRVSAARSVARARPAAGVGPGGRTRAERACAPGREGAGFCVARGARGEGAARGSDYRDVGGCPEWSLVVGWAGRARESWLLSVQWRDVLSADLSWDGRGVLRGSCLE